MIPECVKKNNNYINIFEGSLEAKLPTIWTDGKAQPGRSRARKKLGLGESQKREDKRWSKSEERRCRCTKKWESRETPCFFQCFVAPEGRKVGSLKRRCGASQLARGEVTSCTPLWCEAHFEVKSVKTPHVPSTFGSSDVEKVPPVVARSTFESEHVKKTDHFLTIGLPLDVGKAHDVVARSTFESTEEAMIRLKTPCTSYKIQNM